jgi:predicted component of type VI protein secretion system
LKSSSSSLSSSNDKLIINCLAWNVNDKSQARYIETRLIQFLKDQSSSSTTLFQQLSEVASDVRRPDFLPIYFDRDFDSKHILFSKSSITK